YKKLKDHAPTAKIFGSPNYITGSLFLPPVKTQANMAEALQNLKQLVTSIHPLPEADWNAFASIWKEQSANRKEPLTVAGQTENHLYFVVSGVQRVYYFDDRNREATLVFTYAPSFG